MTPNIASNPESTPMPSADARIIAKNSAGRVEIEVWYKDKSAIRTVGNIDDTTEFKTGDIMSGSIDQATFGDNGYDQLLATTRKIGSMILSRGVVSQHIHKMNQDLKALNKKR